MIYEQNGTFWTSAKGLYTYDADTWKPHKELWYHNGTAWKQLVPPNAIVLYQNSTQFAGKALVADGSSGTTDYTNRFVAGNTTGNVGITGGNSSHSGASHGYNHDPLRSTDYSAERASADWFGDTEVWGTAHSHNHRLNLHEHPDVGNNIPSYTSLIPTMFGSKLYAGAVLLAKANLSSPWTQLSLLNYLYLLSINSSVVTNTTAHTHGSVAAISDTWTRSDFTQDNVNGSTNYLSHHHIVEHTMNSITPEPLFQDVFSYSSAQDYFFNDLPSNSVMIFTNSYLPSGWTQWGTSGQLLRLVTGTTLTSGGTTSHVHGDRTVPSTSIVGDSTWSTKTGSTSEYFTQNHSHNFTDRHSASVNHMPPYMNFVIAYKI